MCFYSYIYLKYTTKAWTKPLKQNTIVLQELLNIGHKYNITADLSFNALESFCVAFTPNSFKLSFQKLYINTVPIPYTDSLKYLGFTFTCTSSHKHDSDMLR